MRQSGQRSDVDWWQLPVWRSLARKATLQMDCKMDRPADRYVKGGQTGLVPVLKDSQILFVPVGAEKIIITNSGNQTVMLQKSERGEFSEPGKMLAYCPDAAQRAYADSRKAR